ncbi:hypothetical protein DH2020_045881 [Rehmannia glutinosa]|uniref:Cyclin-like domain-containing protein n=1 Tax=Rehmannia glutinosa TaxID=99300 RepID=A0ABR0UEN1_REHGL
MIYTAIDTFYLTDEELKNSPSSKDGIDEATETTLRIYGCDLIQESGILLKLYPFAMCCSACCSLVLLLLGIPQAVMATGQVLFHRFYCKKSFARFNVKRIAASCVWLASKLEESPRKARQVLIVFHRMECRRENLPIEHLDTSSKRYVDLKADLIRSERHLLKEMGFICHVEHPHKFISNYLATLETPPELRQEAWNLANDSLRTTLCVRFKSEVVACGVVYAAARRFQVPLPENPPWWKAFDADKSGIDEDGSSAATTTNEDISTAKAVNQEAGKDERIKAALDKLKESKKSDDESKNTINGRTEKSKHHSSRADEKSLFLKQIVTTTALLIHQGKENAANIIHMLELIRSSFILSYYAVLLLHECQLRVTCFDNK